MNKGGNHTMLWFMFFILNFILATDTSDDGSETDNGSTISHNGVAESYSGPPVISAGITVDYTGPVRTDQMISVPMYPMPPQYNTTVTQTLNPSQSQHVVEPVSLSLTSANIRAITDTIQKTITKEVRILQEQQSPQSPLSPLSPQSLQSPLSPQSLQSSQPQSPGGIIIQRAVINQLPDLGVIHTAKNNSQNGHSYLQVGATDKTLWNTPQSAISDTFKPGLIDVEPKSRPNIEYNKIEISVSIPHGEGVLDVSKSSDQTSSPARSSVIRGICKCTRPRGDNSEAV